jgi:hypothetical protein
MLGTEYVVAYLPMCICMYIVIGLQKHVVLETSFGHWLKNSFGFLIIWISLTLVLRTYVLSNSTKCWLCNRPPQ